MNKFLLKKAFTLIELIVATALVAVVVLGIAAVNGVLNNNQQDYGQKYLVTSETQTALDNIINNASLAIGSATLGDEAILLGAACPGAAANTLGCLTDPVNNFYSFCIHQNPTATIGGDIWFCYQWTPANFEIQSCSEVYKPAPVADPRGASSCTYASANGTLIAGAKVNYVGTTNNFVQPGFTLTPQVLFSITLQNCLNNADAVNCNNGTGGNGTSKDPADNPEVQITGKAFPAQVSSS